MGTPLKNAALNRGTGFFSSVGWFFRDFGEAVLRGDLFVKLSLLFMGLGYFRRRQFIKGLLVTVGEVAFILFISLFSAQYIAKFDTLGDVQYEKVDDYFGIITVDATGVDLEKAEADALEAGAKEFVYDEDSPAAFTVLTTSTPKGLKAVKNALQDLGYTVTSSSMGDYSYENDWDNSFKILLYSVMSFVVIALFAYFYINSTISVRKLQLQAEAGQHINSFKDDLKLLMDEKFHETLLFLPLSGILLFTVIPLIVIILVAFTNYNQDHYPPAALFTWVGLLNFKRLFTNSMSVTFGYSFSKIFSWTMIWAFLATFTNFFLGIALALLINNKYTRMKKMWRTCFIIAMAVPQFVSLLLVRNFFSNLGIVNTICYDLGITGFLQRIGLVPASLNYIPFLTKAGWAKFMIVMINIWIGVPYQLLVATGILMNIPAEQYESARIDGANAWQQFWKITMPYMLFVMAPTLINDVVKNINNFNVIYLLQQDIYTTSDMALAASNAKETDLLVTWLFRLTQEYYDYDMASAIGIVVFIISAILTLVAFNVVMRGNREEKFQ